MTGESSAPAGFSEIPTPYSDLDFWQIDRVSNHPYERPAARGSYVAEMYPVVAEQEYVIVDTGRRG